MVKQKIMHRPWKRALFAGLAFAVILSIVSSCLFLVSDLFLHAGIDRSDFTEPMFKVYLYSAAHAYLFGFSLSLVLGFFLFIRMLRIQPTLRFMILQASILWLLMTVLALAPIFKLFLLKLDKFPWEDFFLSNPFYWISIFESFMFWLIAVVISWLSLQILRIV